MKKYMMLFVLVAVFATSLFVPATAQKKSNVGTYTQKYFWGPKIGVNFASLSASENWNRTGLVIGVFGEYKYQSDIGFSGELLYSQQGGQDRSAALGLHIDYLNVPILANWYFGGLALKAGLQAGFLLSSQIKNGRTYIDLEDCNSVDIAIPIGASYSFDFGLKLDVRYNLGITKIIKDVADANAVIQLTVGYIF